METGRACAESGEPLNERTAARFFFPSSTYFSPSAFLSTFTAGCLLSSGAGGDCNENRGQQSKMEKMGRGTSSPESLNLGFFAVFGLGDAFPLLKAGCCA